MSPMKGYKAFETNVNNPPPAINRQLGWGLGSTSQALVDQTKPRDERGDTPAEATLPEKI